MTASEPPPHPRRRARQRGRGQALVEFALVIPLFLLLLISLFDLGRGVFAYNTLTNAAREGARMAIVNQDKATIVERAKDQTAIVELNDPSVSVGFYQMADDGTPGLRRPVRPGRRRLPGRRVVRGRPTSRSPRSSATSLFRERRDLHGPSRSSASSTGAPTTTSPRPRSAPSSHERPPLPTPIPRDSPCTPHGAARRRPVGGAARSSSSRRSRWSRSSAASRSCSRAATPTPTSASPRTPPTRSPTPARRSSPSAWAARPGRTRTSRTPCTSLADANFLDRLSRPTTPTSTGDLLRVDGSTDHGPRRRRPSAAGTIPPTTQGVRAWGHPRLRDDVRPRHWDRQVHRIRRCHRGHWRAHGRPVPSGRLPGEHEELRRIRQPRREPRRAMAA